MVPHLIADTISISTNLPGATNLSTTGPAGWITAFYKFAMIFSGILAFGGIVYGGVRYATAAGNEHSQEEARAWIWSAFIGLLLLAGAYVILYTVNPNLVILKNPSISAVNPNQ